MTNIVQVTRDICYRQSGKYKGIPVEGSIFQKELPLFVPIKTTTSNPVFDLMLRIQSQTNSSRPFVKSTLSLFMNNTIYSDDEETLLTFYDDDAES